MKTNTLRQIEEENAEMIRIAGEAIGTDESLMGPSCVTALANHCAWLREEIEALKDEIARLKVSKQRLEERLRR